MGLMVCRDCQREISDKAAACPGCGRPNAQASCPRCASDLVEYAFFEGGETTAGLVLLFIAIIAFFLHWVAGLLMFVTSIVLFAMPGRRVKAVRCSSRNCRFSERRG